MQQGKGVEVNSILCRKCLKIGTSEIKGSLTKVKMFEHNKCETDQIAAGLLKCVNVGGDVCNVMCT